MAKDSFFLGGKVKVKSSERKKDFVEKKSQKPRDTLAPPKPPRDTLNKKRRKDQEKKEEGEEEGYDDEMDLAHNSQGEEEEEDEFLQETPAQKRLRLAKSYLDKVKEDVADDIMEGEIDAKEIDRALIAERLAKDTDDSLGKIFHCIADNYKTIDISQVRLFKSGKNGHQLSLTCVAVSHPSIKPLASADEMQPIYLFSGSKDAALVKWDFWTGEKLNIVRGGLKPTKRLAKQIGKKNLAKIKDGHFDEILCMDASSDGRFLVTGGKDKAIFIWSTSTNEIMGKLIQHRDAITGLCFRKGHNQLYSASYDRTVKVWNVDEQSYVETLFGHQDKITSIDALSKERCITSGSRDRTCRLWKILEESQLVFRGGGGTLTISEDLVVLENMGETAKRREKDNGASGGSIDHVAMIDENFFVSGSDSGAISLWNNLKKKPIFTRLQCHGIGAPILVNGQVQSMKQEDLPSPGNQSNDTVCNWITSLATVKYSDMFASGSADGYIRLWKISDTKKSFTLINCIPAKGFVNSMTFFEGPSLSTPQDTSANESAPDNESSLLEGRTAIAKRIIEKGKNSISKKAKELYIAAALGQEHRLGRWWRMKSAKNQVMVLSLGPVV